MAVNPPYSIIDSIGRLEAQKQPIWGQALQGILTGVQAYQGAKSAKMDRESDVMKTFLTNYSLKPTDPTAAPGSPVAGDIISAMNRGKIPSSVNPSMAGMQAVPKQDTNLLGHLLPSLIANQPVGKETSVEGGIVQPGAIPGLAPDATVTTKPKGAAAGTNHADSIFAQASSRARATVSQMITQAQADPKSAAGPSANPILGAKTAHEQYIKELRKEAIAGGADPKDVDARVKPVEEGFEKEQKSYEQDLNEGLKVVNREKDPTKRKSLQKIVKERLQKKYPVNNYEIMSHPELK